MPRPAAKTPAAPTQAAALRALRRDNAALSRDLAAAEAALTEKDKDVADALRQVELVRAAYRGCEQQRAGALTKLAEAEKARDEAVADVKSRDRTIAGLRREIAERDVSETTARNMLEAANRALISLGLDLAEAKDRITLLKTRERIRVARENARGANESARDATEDVHAAMYSL
jgi:chromosome segregation ATPase